MATALFIENIKNPKVRFKVLKYDKETGMGTLQGEYGAEFTRNLTKKMLTQYGYRVVEGEVPDEAPANGKGKG